MANTEKTSLLEMVYPVGSIYMSVNATSPSALFGGTWVKIEGRFLLGSGGGYSLGAIGGEAQHTLTINEMPRHNHDLLKGGGDKTDSGGQYQADSGLYEAWADPKSDNLYYWWSATQYSGGGAAHNNMPPYLTVNIWKRTA